MSDEESASQNRNIAKDASMWVALFDKLAGIFPWIGNWLHRPIIVPSTHDRFWHMGKRAGRPAMQLHSRWYVTNQSSRNMRLLGVELRTTGLLRRSYDGHVIVRHPYENFYGDYPLLPHHTTEMSVDLMIQPPLKREGKPFTANIVFTDSNGQTIVKRGIRFQSDRHRPRKIRQLQTENVSDLEDQLSKAVASVLKDELTRYEQNGRQSGGLGSITLVTEGQPNKRTGIYQDSWTSSGAGLRQLIIGNPEKFRVASDNGDQLVSLYQSLENHEEREKFIETLIDRIDRKREYYGVTYLIVYVLMRIGRLSEALEAVNERLPYREKWVTRYLSRWIPVEELPPAQANGYNDAFALLNGMLKWVHSDFSPEDLDTIETAITIADTHTFKIGEKLNSIRAYRLGKQGR